MQTMEMAKQLISGHLNKYRGALNGDPERCWQECMAAVVDGVISLDDAPTILTAYAHLANEAETKLRHKEQCADDADLILDWIDVIHVCLAALRWGRENSEGIVIEHARELLLRCGRLADFWAKQK